MSDDGAIRWPGRVVSALDLERLRGEVRSIIVAPKTIVTPSAREWLRDRGVAVKTQEKSRTSDATWRVAQEREFGVVANAIASLRREGNEFDSWPARGETPVAEWIRWLAAETTTGAIVFTDDPALACCVANRLAAIRAAAVTSVAQAERVLKTMAANWLAVEMPGRTLFEVTRILKLGATIRVEMPADVRVTLDSLGGVA